MIWMLLTGFYLDVVGPSENPGYWGNFRKNISRLEHLMKQFPWAFAELFCWVVPRTPKFPACSALEHPRRWRNKANVWKSLRGENPLCYEPFPLIH